MARADLIFATVRAAPPSVTAGDRAEVTQDSFGLRVSATTAAAVRPTYRVDFGALVGQIGNIVEIAGSATRTVRLNYVFVPKPSAAVVLIGRKQSTASTLGTSTTPTPIPLNSSDAAATAVVRLYTAAPTAGTLIAAVFGQSMGSSDVFRELFGEGVAQQLTLNGVAETFALNISAAATVRGYIEWTEEAGT